MIKHIKGCQDPVFVKCQHANRVWKLAVRGSNPVLVEADYYVIDRGMVMFYVRDVRDDDENVVLITPIDGVIFLHPVPKPVGQEVQQPSGKPGKGRRGRNGGAQ